MRTHIVLKGTSLGTHIKNKGGSIEEVNKLIARSVRAAGLYTKTGAATAGASLQMILIQKYGVKIPYRGGGKVNVYGAWSNFGYKYTK